ncbi:hypothetical protein [Methylobacterium sp. D54C]|jgi:hypothetical protein
MPRTMGTNSPRRLRRAEATRIVRSSLHFVYGPPDEERRFGHEMGTAAVRYDPSDRAELVRILDVLKRGRGDALIELQQAAHIRGTPSGRVRRDLFAAHMFGGARGSIQGDYASGYFGAIASVEHHVRSLD